MVGHNFDLTITFDIAKSMAKSIYFMEITWSSFLFSTLKNIYKSLV